MTYEKAIEPPLTWNLSGDEGENGNCYRYIQKYTQARLKTKVLCNVPSNTVYIAHDPRFL